MILEADLHLLVLKRGNLFDENCCRVQYSVIVVTKMITYKFLRGVLLRMHDRSAYGVFHLAILALPDSVNFDCFSPVPAKVQLVSQK